MPETTEATQERAEKLVPALERGTRILDLVAKTGQPLTAADIAREMGLARSSVHGLCTTLVALNLLVKRPDQSYQLGPHVMRWANAFSQKSDVATEFAAIWDQGTQLPGATITLSVLEGAEVIYLAARNSDAVPHFGFRIGMRLPAPFTATGKAFLAHMPDHEVRRLLAGQFPKPLTVHSVTSVDALLAELSDVRARGYSVDDEQVVEGMVCFAASVLNSNNRPIAGVAVSLPKGGFDKAEEDSIVRNVKEIAGEISRRLGADL